MIEASVCDCYLGDIIRGVHRPDDTYRLALYDKGATLSCATERYSAAHEVPDSGSYRSGGGVLSGFYVDDGCLHFDDVTFTKATITKPAGALVYNASKGDRAVAVLRFSEPVESVLGTFKVELPVPLLTLVTRWNFS